MCFTDFIKRFLPFALTFTAGLFIASFFVTIGMPKFGSRHREKHRNEFLELQIRLQDSEDENIRLRGELNRVKSESSNIDTDTDTYGEIPLVPPPPVAPTAPHRRR